MNFASPSTKADLPEPGIIGVSAQNRRFGLDSDRAPEPIPNLTPGFISSQLRGCISKAEHDQSVTKNIPGIFPNRPRAESETGPEVGNLATWGGESGRAVREIPCVSYGCFYLR